MKTIRKKSVRPHAAGRPLVAIIMGSASDARRMSPAREMLERFGVSYEIRVISAHRTPDLASRYADEARTRGIEVIIAGAGGAAHLAGVVASRTTLPVVGVPILTKSLRGLDSLLSTVQMPTGIPVATVAIDGAANAGLLAVRILSLKHGGLRAGLADYQREMKRKVLQIKL